jgi:hypothetical protein
MTSLCDAACTLDSLSPEASFTTKATARLLTIVFGAA